MTLALIAATACTIGASAAPAPRDDRTPETRAVDPEQSGTIWARFLDQRRAWTAELADTAASCTRRRDTRHAVFHGCIDWHSAVHGHWALLAASRITGDGRHGRIATERLDPERLAAEQAYLQTHPNFEMPYGRAWFLRLALELHRTGSDRLDGFGRMVAKSLIAFYERTPPSPQAPEYDNASWAMRQLHDYCRAMRDDVCLERVRGWVGARFRSGHPRITADNDASVWQEFFSRWGNWAHLLEAMTDGKQVRLWLGSHPAGTMQPVDTFGNAHHTGINFARAWGFYSVYRATGGLAYRDAAVRHIETGMMHHARLKNRYGAYGHWVPQFGIYALSYMEERDARHASP